MCQKTFFVSCLDWCRQTTFCSRAFLVFKPKFYFTPTKQMKSAPFLSAGSSVVAEMTFQEHNNVLVFLDLDQSHLSFAVI